MHRIDRNRADAHIAKYHRRNAALPVGCIRLDGEGERTGVDANRSGVGETEGYDRGTSIDNDPDRPAVDRGRELK